MMSRNEIIEALNEFFNKINDARQTEGEEPLVKSHILICKDQPEQAILVLMSEENGDAYIYRPLTGNEQPSVPFYNEPDEILFRYLEEDYEIAEMDLDTHAAIWNYISVANRATCQEGFQKYLEYCMQNGVTLEKLRSEYDYTFYDLFSLYNVSAKEDLFLRVDAFKEKLWYGDLIMFSRIGVCKTKPECAPEVCKALNQLGYSVRLKAKDGELYVFPAKDKKLKEMEAR